MSMLVEIHRDDLASKTGMWLFLFTEMLLFGGLFVVYTVYRFRNQVAFHLAAGELSVVIGTLNTVILLTSSATLQQPDNRKLFPFLSAGECGQPHPPQRSLDSG